MEHPTLAVYKEHNLVENAKLYDHRMYVITYACIKLFLTFE